MSRQEAKQRIHNTAVITTPTGQAAKAGVIGPEHLTAIGTTLKKVPSHISTEEKDTAEQILLQAAKSLDGSVVAKLGHKILTQMDQDGTPPREQDLREPLHRLYTRTKTDGTLIFHGQLAPEAGALFTAVLSPLAKLRASTPDGPDGRSVPERQGDALAEMVQLAAGNTNVPTEAGEPPHVTVTVPLEVLEQRVGTADTGRGGFG